MTRMGQRISGADQDADRAEYVQTAFEKQSWVFGAPVQPLLVLS